MSQASLSIPNSSGATLRQNVSNALQALGSAFSGASAPSTTYAYMLWLDTTTGQLKMRDSSNSSWIILWESTGPTFPLIGLARNLKANVTTASQSVAYTADEIVLKTALGGTAYMLANYSKTLNIATTGAGGMDTGAAPISGYVAVYAIYNPTTKTASILGRNCTSIVAGEVYGGANMPSGYTASALIGVLPTNSSGQFIQLSQEDRKVIFFDKQVLSTATQSASPLSVGISSAVPLNARAGFGFLSIGATGAGQISASVFHSSSGYCGQGVTLTGQSAGTLSAVFEVEIPTAQTIYYTAQAGGTLVLTININGYRF